MGRFSEYNSQMIRTESNRFLMIYLLLPPEKIVQVETQGALQGPREQVVPSGGKTPRW